METHGARDAEARVLSSVPTFLVHDVGATARWYVERLGFTLAGTFPASEPYAYASLQRGGAELMLLRLDRYTKADFSAQRPEGVWDAYLRSSGVRQLYESLRGASFITTPLRQQPYSDWEFEVRDPNGYVLVFGGSE